MTLTASNRVKSIPPYAFASLAVKLNAMIADGVDVIRLDIGNPDMPPAPHIVDALVESARRDDTHGYGGYYGIPALRQAIADYYAARFGVTLDVKTELTPLIGSKEGLANLNLAWLDAGDIALVPDPGYLTYSMGPLLANASVVAFDLKPENHWLPDLDAIPADVAQRARLLWLNYPNNPTGALGTEETFRRAIDFCRKYDILLCHDNPYSDIAFDGYRAPSILAIPGAKEVVIEFNSLSKSHNLAGWRLGMAVGNATAIKALATVKTQIDTGHPIPVQRMAIAALTGDQSWLQTRNAEYQKRRDIAVQTLRSLGFDVAPQKATLYLWFPVLHGFTDVELHEKILAETGVSIAPGSIYGENGCGWMRLSISAPTARLAEAMERLKTVRW